MKMLGLAAAAAVILSATPGLAQTRVNPTPKPPSASPSYQATPIDPVFERLNKLQADLNELKARTAKQVVVLHFSPADLGGGWEENNYNQNKTRAENLCKEALGDRYGRHIAHRNWTSNGRFYFSHVSCETKL